MSFDSTAGATERRRRGARTAVELRRRFDVLSSEGRGRTLEGRFREALRCYRLARAYASRLDDAGLRDAAELNVAMVRLQLGQARRGEDGLREILLRASDPRVAFSAAYHLASALRQQSRFDKAAAYATRALDRARALGSADALAMAEMLSGNILLARSYHDEALAHYRRALDIRGAQEGDTRYSRAILLENLGYCLVLGGDLEAGRETLERALALANEVGDLRCRAECHQDLSYADLLDGALASACGHGERALALALECGYDDIEENCHYLLGEARGRSGEIDARDRHFARLQELHPEIPFLEDFLCAVDVTGIITLKR